MRSEQSRTHKILVVDDDEHIRLLYTSEFEAEGYDVTAAATARQALKVLESEPPDAVILDIKMPDMNGIDALQKMAGIVPHVPIIISSAYSHFKDNFLTWIAVDYLVKSSDLGELKDSVRETLCRMTETTELRQAAG
jgi:DNA-binding NtrC family response regulator